MSRVANLITQPTGTRLLFDGTIARDVESMADLAEIVVPAFDPDHIFTSAPWMPRGAALPQAGDACVVVLAETDVAGTPEPWIVGWWNGSEILLTPPVEEPIGDGSSVNFSVTHGFGNRTCNVIIRQNAAPYEVVDATIRYSTPDTVEIMFISPPSVDQYVVIVRP